MAARRKSFLGCEQEDRLRPSVSAGSVHGDVVRRRSPHSLPTQRGFLAYLGGFSAGLLCSCMLFLLTLWLPIFARHAMSTSGKVAVALPLVHKSGSINNVHAKWLTEASTTLSVRVPLHYLVLLQNSKDLQSVCSTWGRYTPKEQITAFTVGSEGHGPFRSCGLVTPVLEARMSALKMLQHVCDKPRLLESTSWFFLINASHSYPVVRNLERFVSTLSSSTLSYIGQPVAYSTGHRICAGDKGVLLTSKAVKSICSALDWCTDAFASGTDNSFIALGLCLYGSLQLNCQPSTGQYVVGSQLLKSPPMSPLPDSTLVIYQPKQIDETSYLMFHQKALWLDLESMNTIEEHSIADLTILKEKMPQLEYMIRLGASHPRSLSDNEVVGWDLIDFDSVYSEHLSEPIKFLHGAALAEMNQIKRKVKQFMQHLSFGESVHNIRVDTVHRHLDVKTGLEYIVAVEVAASAKDSMDSLAEPRRRKYQVHVSRPLQLAQFTGTVSSDDAHSNAPVHVLLFLEGKDAEGKLTFFLTKNTQLLTAREDMLITIAAPDLESTQQGSLRNVSSSLLQHTRVSFLSGNSLSVAEHLAAFVQELSLDCILLVTSWKMTLPLPLIHHCQGLSVVGHQLYMPIALSKLNNSWAKSVSESPGFWAPDQHEVFCGWVQDIKKIFNSVDTIPQHFTMIDFFHELLLKGFHIVRMAEGGLHSVASDDTMAGRRQRSHLISKILKSSG